MLRAQPRSPRCPYTTLFRSFCALGWSGWLPSTAGPMQMPHACENVRTVEYGAKLNLPPMAAFRAPGFVEGTWALECLLDRKSTRLNSSHGYISYAVFCLKKK